MKTKNKTAKIFIYIALIFISLLCLFPLYWLVRSSFMSYREIFATPMRWFPEKLLFSNFSEALEKMDFLTQFKNTLIIVVVNIFGTVLSSSFVAFGFTRINFPGRNFWFGLLMLTMMIPGISLIIPQFIVWKTVGFYDTLIPLIFPSFFASAFNVFLLKQFYSGIPKDYDEAVYIDGGNYFTVYTKIIMPLTKPALTTICVFTFMNCWNDFFNPFIYLQSKEKYTLALGLQAFMGQYVSEWNLLLAASLIIIIPMIILFFFAQKHFIEGITFSGLKG